MVFTRKNFKKTLNSINPFKGTVTKRPLRRSIGVGKSRKSRKVRSKKVKYR